MYRFQKGKLIYIASCAIIITERGIIMARPSELLEVTFWQKVKIGNENECWEWSLSKDKDGYGNVKKEKKNLRAHRIAWKLTYGDIPSGLMVLHKCDNPTCCNPKHLFLGTNTDNMQDMVRKGRGNGGRLDKHGLAKINLETSKEIKKLYYSGRFDQNDLAVLFSVSQSSISLILHEKHWNDEKVPVDHTPTKVKQAIQIVKDRIGWDEDILLLALSDDLLDDTMRFRVSWTLRGKLEWIANRLHIGPSDLIRILLAKSIKDISAIIGETQDG